MNAQLVMEDVNRYVLIQLDPMTVTVAKDTVKMAPHA